MVMPSEPTRDHPRMCGEHGIDVCFIDEAQGSSPHVRGAQWVGSHAKYGVGIIPACAGSTRRGGHAIRVKRDHPRMCGEHYFGDTLDSAVWGSSPHVRGAR